MYTSVSMSSPVGPKLPGWIHHPLETIQAETKTLWSIFQKKFHKPSALREMPRRGYTLIQDAKQAQREQVFAALANASKEAEGIFQKITGAKDSDFYSSLVELHELLKLKPADFQAANKQALKLIRSLVSSKEYHDNRTVESNPAIKYIHRLVLACVIDNKPLHSFEEIGASLKPEEGLTADTFGAQVVEGRERGQKNHKLIKNDCTVEYFARFTKCVLSSLKGERILPWLGTYDPRMEEENYPGSISEEEISRNGRKVKLRTVITPSPTLGDCAAPETRAFLQALENRGGMSDEDLQNDPYPYTHWTFTNFQNLVAHNEGKRAHAIMDLQKGFPHAFTGLTLSLESEFFLDGVKGKDEEKIIRQKIEHAGQGLTDDYAEKMFEHILTDPRYLFPQPPKEWAAQLHDIIFKAKDVVLEGAARKVSAFPTKEGKIEQAAERVFQQTKTQAGKSARAFTKITSLLLDPILRLYKKVVSVLFDRVPWPSPPLSAEEQKRIENWEKKAAFRELVVLGLIRYWQLQSVPQKGDGLTTCACKESVDRGAQVNSALLWALGKTPETLDAAFNLVQGRALTTRCRLILLVRLAPAHALWKHVPQEQAYKFLIGIQPTSGLSALVL